MAVRHKHANGNGVEARLEALRTDLEALQHDLRGLVEDVKGEAGERVADAVRSAGEAANDARDRVEDWADNRVDSLRVAVRNQPLTSCAISMSAGALIGALLLRR